MMSTQQLHALFTDRFGLVPEPAAHLHARTWFLHRVDRHPATSTRVVKVFHASGGEPSHLQLCASSDNNHAVLLHQPLDEAALAAALEDEIARVGRRRLSA